MSRITILKRALVAHQRICGSHAGLSCGCLILFPSVTATQGFLSARGRGCWGEAESEWGEGWSGSLSGLDSELGGLHPTPAVGVWEALGGGQRMSSLVLISGTISSYYWGVKWFFRSWAPYLQNSTIMLGRGGLPVRLNGSSFCHHNTYCTPDAALGIRNIKNKSLRRGFIFVIPC